MYRRLSIAQFLGSLIGFIEERTGVKCYDDPDNKPSPLYSVQLVRTQPQNTKTMYIDTYEVWVHCISEAVQPHSNAPVLNLVQTLEEALSTDLPLPEPFKLYRQEYEGLQTLKRDESGEGHAVLAYRFFICYGYRCK
ncbi:DUF5072 family protein [Adlercreutzia muris]|uniref:DUF5072 family protein n=1 Tax=Adlercreutzia muris TaxID=1796610 RepID=UPI0035194D79